VHEYETVFILDPGLDEAQVNDEVEKTSNLISTNGGKIVDVQRWGRKRLAYEINKKRDGVYTMIKHESTGDTVKELERRLRLNDSVMRVLTVIAGPEWEEVPAEGDGITPTAAVAPVGAPADTAEGVAEGAGAEDAGA